MRVDTSDVPALRSRLETLSGLLQHARFRLPFPGRAEHEVDRSGLVQTISEYLLPRLRDPDAPAVASILGETGVGKSLLINTLAQDRISETGVLRPTTTSPVLWAHRDHAGRYWSEFVARVRERVGPALEVVIGDDPLTSNLTIIDTPPIDHVSGTGTLAAREVLQLSDLCVFVTSVTRYADATGWQFLHEARRRGTPILFVVNRLPADRDVATALLADYARRLFDDDLLLDPDPAMVFGVEEGSIERWHGGLPPAAVGGLRKELGELADPEFRKGLIEQTTYSSVRALSARAEGLSEAFRREQDAADRLSAAVTRAYDGEARRLHAELARGDFTSLTERALWPQAAVDLTGIVTRRAGVAAQQAAAEWAAEPSGEQFLAEGGHGLWRHGHDTTYETQRLLDAWAEETQQSGVRRSRRGWYRRSVRKKVVEHVWPMVLAGTSQPDRWLERHFGNEAPVMLKDASARLREVLQQALQVDAARFTNFLGDPSPLRNLGERITEEVAEIVAIAEESALKGDETNEDHLDDVRDDEPVATAFRSDLEAGVETADSVPDGSDGDPQMTVQTSFTPITEGDRASAPPERAGLEGTEDAPADTEVADPGDAPGEPEPAADDPTARPAYDYERWSERRSTEQGEHPGA